MLLDVGNESQQRCLNNLLTCNRALEQGLQYSNIQISKGQYSYYSPQYSNFKMQ